MMSTSDNSSSPKACCFCNLAEDNELEYGKIYEHNGIVTHYYCLLLSSNMEQKGNDDEGILGFLPDEISKELRRGKRLACSYCKKIGATLGCCNIKCKRIFHFPCGLKAGSLHQFFGEFRSYCVNHRPKQKIDDILEQINSLDNIVCYICYDKVNPKNFVETLWAPCCKKDAWFHRKCVQQLALSAGYFFKCPLCNNKKIFQEAMLEYGIFVPSQDASWELVPNAFEELLYRHDQCDAARCLCPKGRKHTSNNAKWELTLCRTCGSQGIHMACGQLKWANPVWECSECISILCNAKDNANAESGSSSDGSSQGRDSDSDSDSDTDISVGTDFPALCPSPSLSSSSSSISPDSTQNIRLRPGPRSFKLQQQIQVERMIKRKLESIRTTLEKNVTTKISPEDTGNSSPKNDDKEKEEPLTSEENISQQKSEENTFQQKSEENTFQQKSEENNSQKEKQSCSNDEKSQSIPTEPIVIESDVITIESDDEDDVEIIALKQRKYSQRTAQSGPSSLECITKPLLNVMKNSAASNDTTSANLSKKDDLPIVLESEVPDKSESTLLKQAVAVTSRESTPHPIVLNSDDSEDTNAEDANDFVMNIKITNVTSLPPEVFDSVPDVSSEDFKLSNNSVNTSDLMNKTLEKLVAHISPPKRSMHEEENDVTDSNCKKIKGNDFDKKRFWEKPATFPSVAHDTNRQNEKISLGSEIREGDKDPSKCTSASVNEISKLNKSQKDDLTIRLVSSHKTDDVRQDETNSEKSNTSFNVQQNNENPAKIIRKKIPVTAGNQFYLQLPPLGSFYLKKIPNPQILPKSLLSQDVANNRNTFLKSSNDVLLSQETSNSNTNNVNRQTVIVSQPAAGNVTVPIVANNDRMGTLNKKQEAVLANEKLSASVSSPGNSSSDNVRCDGDAGTSPAETDSTGQRRNAKDSTDDTHWSVDGSDAVGSPSSAATRNVFPQITNNHNTCHQPRLIPQYMNLHDLKFRVCGSNSVQMILYDMFSVNIPTTSPKERKIRSASLTASREPRESSASASTRDEASSSLNYADDTRTAEPQRFDKYSRSSPRNESYSINDKTKYVARGGHDDTKENLDPVKSRVSSHSGTSSGNLSLTNNVDDHTTTTSDHVCDEADNETCLVSSDINLNELNRTICNTNIVNVTNSAAYVPNDREQIDSQVDSEDVQQHKQFSVRGTTPAPTEEKTGSGRLFCKESNRTVHSVDFDLNVVNTNKNVEKILQDNVTVFTSQHVGDDEGIGNDHTDDSPVLRNGYKHLDSSNVTRRKIHNGNVARISNIRFNERSILHKQIDACDSSRFIRCRAFHENTINRNSENSAEYNSESCVRVSIDLCKIQNLIDSKPELFVNQGYDADDRPRKCKSRSRGQNDYTRLVRYRDIQNGDNIKHCPSKNRELQVPNCASNVEQTQIRDAFSGVRNTFVRY